MSDTVTPLPFLHVQRLGACVKLRRAMRTDIYYWKCDSPIATEAKRRVFFKEKYARSTLVEPIRNVVRDWQGEVPAAVTPFNSDGNHFAYVIAMPDGRRYFFRGDEGLVEDDYLLAETRVLQDVHAVGVPVPRVWRSGSGLGERPIQFQILDCLDYPNLNEPFKAGTLDVRAIATQMGSHLRRLHSLTYPGFGFFNTERIRRDGVLVGLDATYADYFNKRLEHHLGYLVEHTLVTREDAGAIREVLRDHAADLNLQQGVLVHRDLALWNILGTPERVMAIIDWDDCVVGDPADDLGIIACFHGDEYMVPLLASYAGGAVLPADFVRRIHLHTLRNMLWKTMIRHYMGYFDKDDSFFLNSAADGRSLRERTLARLFMALNDVRSARG